MAGGDPRGGGAPVSLLRTVHRERVLLVGGQRALVMQLAHPLVATGVAEHTDFPHDAFRRLRRTIDLTLATVFGTPGEAAEAADRIRAVHRRVKGTAEVGGVRRRYRAEDPALLLWVHATLVDTTLEVFPRFVRPLTLPEAARYYEESKEPARLLGIPQDVLPPNLDAFRAYVTSVLEGPELRATDESRALVASVLRPPTSFALRPAVEAARLVTLALLPGRVRSMFCLRAGPAVSAVLAMISGTSRLLLPALPGRLRTFSAARASPRRSATIPGR